MTTMTTDHARGLLITGFGGLMLTIDIPLIRLSNGDPWTVMMLRTGATFAVAILVWLVWRNLGRNPPRLIPGLPGLAVATLYGATSVTFMLAVYRTSTANLVFILAFNTVFAGLLSWGVLGERPRAVTVAAMVLMLVGVLVIVQDGLGSGNFAGDMLALASAFLIACAITVSRASREDMGLASLVAVVLPFALASVMVAQVGYRVEEPFWILLNGAVVMPVAFFCLATGPRYITGPEVAMFYLLETVLAPVWVWMIFAEVPTNATLIGGSILILTLIAHAAWQLRESRRQRKALGRSPRKAV